MSYSSCKPDAILQRADIMPEMERSGRPIAGENSLVHRLADFRADCAVVMISAAMSFISGPGSVSRHIGMPTKRESLIRRPERFESEVAFADMLMAIDARMERLQRIVEMKRDDAIECRCARRVRRKCARSPRRCAES